MSRSAKSKTRTIPVRMCAEIVFASRLPVLLWVKRWLSVDCTWRGFRAGTGSRHTSRPDPQLLRSSLHGRSGAGFGANPCAGPCRCSTSANRRGTRPISALVAGEFASAEMAHCLGVKRRIAAHDKSLDGFPAGRVRHTDYGAILRTRKPGEHCFHPIGIDIEAGDEDHVL